MFRTVSSMWPLATTKSRSPSRSKSANAQPKPSEFLEAAPTPDFIAMSSKRPRPPARYQRYVLEEDEDAGTIKANNLVVELRDSHARQAQILKHGRVEDHPH